MLYRKRDLRCAELLLCIPPIHLTEIVAVSLLTDVPVSENGIPDTFDGALKRYRLRAGDDRGHLLEAGESPVEKYYELPARGRLVTECDRSTA